MKKYRLLQYLPGAVPGMLVDCSSDRAALELRIVPSDYPAWFEELPESQEREEGCKHNPAEAFACSKCGDSSFGHPQQTVEKEECKHESKTEIVSDDQRTNVLSCDECGELFKASQPKQKPSQIIEEKMLEFLGESYHDFEIESARLWATISFLDEQFNKNS